MEGNEKVKIEEVTDNLKEYINTRYEILLLKAGEKTANIASQLSVAILLLFSFILFIIFLSMGAGYYVSDLLHSTYAGFMIVAGFYLLLIIVVLLVRKGMIMKPMRNKIIRELFKED
jgi:uncharacterized membrane protein (UPF0182 family)